MSLDGGAPIALPDEPPGPGIIRRLLRRTLRQREMKDIGRSEHAILRIISHAAIGCAGAIGGWLVATGELGIVPSFAQAPAASPGQRSTELFNRVMDDVLGRRLTFASRNVIPATAARRIGIREAIPSAISWRGATR